MNMKFMHELRVSASGYDCPAEAAWLETAIRQALAANDVGAMAVERACAHWDKADEDTQYRIAERLGMVNATGQEWPVDGCIKTDYETAYTVISETLG